MSVIGLSVPTPDFPLVGNQVPVALFFMLHIAVAEYSAGAIAIAPVMEARGRRRGDAWALWYAKSLTRSYYLVFSLGATLAVFAVVVLIGLWGREMGDLFNVFLPLVGVLFGLFLLLTPALVIYANTFETTRGRLHVGLGFVVMALQTLFVIGITMLDTYLITPRNAGLVGGALNAPYLPLVVHRLMGNVSWTALLLAGFAALRLGRASDEGERLFHAWAARINLRIGLLFGVLMPVDGFVLLEVLRHDQVGFFSNLVSGDAAWLFVLQEALFGAVLVAGNVALALEAPAAHRLDGVGRLAVGITSGGMLVGILPAGVLGSGTYGLRYAGIAAAVVATTLHIAVRSLPRGAMPRLAPAPGAAIATPYAPALARGALAAAGLLAAAIALLMGYMKEEARAQYSFYGELTQTQGHGQFDPGGGLYP